MKYWQIDYFTHVPNFAGFKVFFKKATQPTKKEVLKVIRKIGNDVVKEFIRQGFKYPRIPQGQKRIVLGDHTTTRFAVSEITIVDLTGDKYAFDPKSGFDSDFYRKRAKRNS